MKVLILALAGFYSPVALAATDYNHCKGYIESQVKYRRLGMEVGADGKLTVKPNPVSAYNYSLRKGVHEFSAAEGQFVISVETADGRPQKIVETEYHGKAYSKNIKSDHYDRKTVAFEERNGVCFPARKDLESIVPHASNAYSDFKSMQWETRNSLEWHTELCRDIVDFVQRNPKIAECRCGDDAANKALTRIIAKFDPNYPPKVKPQATEEAVQTTLNTLGSPLAKAYAYMGKCDLVAGAVLDARIWKRSKSSAARTTAPGQNANSAE